MLRKNLQPQSGIYRSSNHNALILLFIFTTGFIFLCTNPAYCKEASNEKKNLLILSSYHQGYKWSDEIFKGQQDALSPIMDQIAIHVEYLDMKRHYTTHRMAELFQSLSVKYRDINIDLVLSADDAAFLFLKKYRIELFPDAIIFFCGTNYLEENDLEGLRHFYGVTEKADIESTLSTALTLHPETEEIYIINDITITGNKVAPYIHRAIEKHKESITFHRLGHLPFDEIVQQVGNLPPHSLILYTFFFRDIEGNTFEYNESIGMIAEATNVPIYGTWDFNMGLGIIGGMMTSGYHQGYAAGALAVDHINKPALEPSQRLFESPNKFIFDYTQLTKYNISETLLPQNAILINKPISFFAKHRKVILFSATFILMQLIIIIFLVFNIIMRRKAEKELRQSESNFRGIFENAIEGIFQITLNRVFLKVNDSLAQILRCDSPGDVLLTYRAPAKQLFAKRDDIRTILYKIKKFGKAQQEVDILCKDNSRRTVLLYCHEVTNEDGDHLYLEGSMTDMTEYKLTQEIMIQTEKLISLGGVAAGIAHEVKNPLTSIIQASSVIGNRLFESLPANIKCAEKHGMDFNEIAAYAKDREIRAMIDNIINSGKRAQVIVDDMLAFSRKNIENFTEESLVEILQEAIELAKKDYSLSRDYVIDKIPIEQRVAGELPLILCNKSKIIQVLFNLLKNSAEAMEESTVSAPKISCHLFRDVDYVILELRDNGPGIPQDIKDRIFEPFFSTKDRSKGTGLGLSVSYFIITEDHKGEMVAESKENNGAKFVIKLPVPQADTTKLT